MSMDSLFVCVCLSVTALAAIYIMEYKVLLNFYVFFHRLSRGSTHQSLHDILYDSESSSEASEEEEQQDRRPVRQNTLNVVEHHWA